MGNKFDNLADKILDEKTTEGLEEKVEEKKDPLDGLSLAERLNVLEEKKNEISQLEEERLEYYNQVKDFEDKMISFGISKDQREKIRQQISTEGGEISQKIIDIRNEYGIEPTPVEILSNRMLMMMIEKERVSKKLQIAKKDELKSINYILDGLRSDNYVHLDNWIDYFLKTAEAVKERDDENISDYFSFSEKIKDAMKNKPVDPKLIDKMFVDFSVKLGADIKKNNSYKTPLEEKEDQERLSKINRIIDKIYSELKMARQGEGRYSEK